MCVMSLAQEGRGLSNIWGSHHRHRLSAVLDGLSRDIDRFCGCIWVGPGVCLCRQERADKQSPQRDMQKCMNATHDSERSLNMYKFDCVASTGTTHISLPVASQSPSALSATIINTEYHTKLQIICVRLRVGKCKLTGLLTKMRYDGVRSFLLRRRKKKRSSVLRKSSQDAALQRFACKNTGTPPKYFFTNNCVPFIQVCVMITALKHLSHLELCGFQAMKPPNDPKIVLLHFIMTIW